MAASLRPKLGGSGAVFKAARPPQEQVRMNIFVLMQALRAALAKDLTALPLLAPAGATPAWRTPEVFVGSVAACRNRGSRSGSVCADPRAQRP